MNFIVLDVNLLLMKILSSTIKIHLFLYIINVKPYISVGRPGCLRFSVVACIQRVPGSIPAVDLKCLNLYGFLGVYGRSSHNKRNLYL
jgi:hypothetical protein